MLLVKCRGVSGQLGLCFRVIIYHPYFERLDIKLPNVNVALSYD